MRTLPLIEKFRSNFPDTMRRDFRWEWAAPVVSSSKPGVAAVVEGLAGQPRYGTAAVDATLRATICAARRGEFTMQVFEAVDNLADAAGAAANALQGCVVDGMRIASVLLAAERWGDDGRGDVVVVEMAWALRMRRAGP